jgi:hypothetical protein
MYAQIPSHDEKKRILQGDEVDDESDDEFTEIHVEAGDATEAYDEEDNVLSQAQHRDAELDEIARRKRTRQRDIKRAIKDDEVEEVPLYQGNWNSAFEKKVALWGSFKGVVFFLFMAGAFWMFTTDYSKRACLTGRLESSGDTYCLDYSDDFTCVGTDSTVTVGGDTCETTCASSPPSVGDPEGCKVNTKTPAITCYNSVDMATNCKDTTTCSDIAESDIKDVLIIMGLLYASATFLEFFVCTGNNTYSEFHIMDFRTRRHNHYVFGLTKVGPWLTQLNWLASFAAAAYFLGLSQLSHAECFSYATEVKTIAGGTYVFFDQALYFAVGNFTMLVVVLILGSLVRCKCPARGEMYRPSQEGTTSVRYDLDCRSIRSRQDEPKCCYNFWTRGPTWCRMVCGWLPLPDMCFNLPLLCGRIVTIAMTPLLMAGWCCEQCWRYRHFMGP